MIGAGAITFVPVGLVCFSVLPWKDGEYVGASVMTLFGLLGTFFIIRHGVFESLKEARQQAQKRAELAAWKEQERLRIASLSDEPASPPVVELQALCRACLSHFGDLPEPVVRVEPESHFRRPCQAHMHSVSVICFDADYFNRATLTELRDTMMHELLHCWMAYDHFHEELDHGPRFEMACKLLSIEFCEAWRTT